MVRFTGFFVSVARRAFLLLDAREKLLFFFYTFVLLFLNLLDILGVLLLAKLSSNIYAANPQIQNQFGLMGVTVSQSNRGLILVLALSLLVSKTTAGLFIMWKFLNFLAVKQVNFSKKLMLNYLHNNLLSKNHTSMQKIVFTMNDSVNSIFTGVLFPSIGILADFVLTFFLFLFLLAISPILTILNSLIFIFLFVTGKTLSKFIQKNGQKYTDSAIEAREIVSESYDASREISSYHIQEFILNKFVIFRENNSTSLMKISYLQLLPKFLFEIVLIFCAFAILSYAYFFGHDVPIYTFIFVFLASAYRILPAILRIQGNYLHLKSQQPAAELGLSYGDSYYYDINKVDNQIELTELVQPPKISIIKLNFQYPNFEKIFFENLDLEFLGGSLNVVFGQSGSGKSTLINLILGFIPLSPSDGQILIDGRFEKLSNFKNVAYVPQNPYIFTGSILENITFKSTLDEVNKEWLNKAIRMSCLNDFVENAENGLETLIKNTSSNLSGGERQRLCLARAFYSQPKVLILDESLNALDLDNENSILLELSSLKKSCTIILISHSTLPLNYADFVLSL